MPAKTFSEKYRPGQFWAFQNTLAEFLPSFFIWRRHEDEEEEAAEAFEIVVEATEAAQRDWNIRGLIYRVTADLLERSGARLIEERKDAPTWLPASDSEDRPAEALHAWETFSEETVADLLRSDLPWLQSLARAIDDGAVERVERILAGNPQAVQDRQFSHAAPLCRAVELGNKAIVELLLHAGAEVNSRDDSGTTPLHVAAGNGEKEIAELLIQHGANLDARDDEGHTPLCLAASRENPACARMLEDRGAAVDLTILIRLGRLREASLLLQNNPQACAQACVPKKLVLDLIERLKNVPEDLSEAAPEYQAILKQMLDQGLDVNAGFCLREAVRLNDTTLAQLLLERGANPNLEVEYGNYLLPKPACGSAMRALLKKHGAKSEDDPDVVIPRTSETLSYNPEDVEARVKRAQAWKEVGQYQRACADLEVIFQLDEENLDAGLLQAWIWSACPDEHYRDGAKAVELAQKLDESFLVGISWEDDGSEETWDTTDFKEALAAALAEQGEFEQALAVLEEIDMDRAGPDNRERITRMKEAFAADRPFRDGPPSPPLAELGRQLAELVEVGEQAVVIRDEDEEEDDEEEEEEDAITLTESGEVSISYQDSFGIEGVRRLLAHSRVEEVTSLKISSSGLEETEILLLVDGLAGPRLSRLDLGSNCIRDKAGAVLAAVTRWRLMELHLSSNKLGQRTAQALAANPALTDLKILNLWSNRIRVAGARALAESLFLKSLEDLNLGSNVIRDEGASLLAASANFPSLVKLDLSGNRLSARGLAALAQSPFLAQLTELSLWDNRLHDDAVVALAASPHLSRLDGLTLFDNRIGAEGAKALAAAPILANVTNLDLHKNPIGPEGVKALAASPHVARIETLNLNSCRLDAGAAVALAESPHLERIKTLNISKEEVGKEGRKVLRKRFGDMVSFY